MAGRVLFVWVLIGALLGVGAASSAYLVDVAPTEVAAATSVGVAPALAAPVALANDFAVTGVEENGVYIDCAKFADKYPNSCPKPPAPSPASITNVSQSCEGGVARLRIEGTSNLDRLLVELMLGNSGSGRGVDVVDGMYSVVFNPQSDVLPATFTITVSDDITDFAITTVLVQPCDAPTDPTGTIVFNDDGVMLSCEMGNYLVSVSGTANVPVVTVEAFDGGVAGSADFTVTNGRYSGELIVPASPDTDSGSMTAIVHTPEPNFMAIGAQDTFTYSPCV